GSALAASFGRQLLLQLGPEGDGPLARSLSATSEHASAGAARGIDEPSRAHRGSSLSGAAFSSRSSSSQVNRVSHSRFVSRPYSLGSAWASQPRATTASACP